MKIPLKVSGALTDGGTLSVGTTEINLSVLPSEQTGYLVLDFDKATGAEEVSFSHSGSNPVTISATTVEHSGTCNFCIDNTDGYYQALLTPITNLSTIGARAYLANLLGTTVENSVTKVALDAESYDLGSNFSDGKFTAPIAGYYSISATINYGSLVADKRYAIVIKVNGSQISESSVGNGGIVNYVAAGISDIIHLDAEDYVELFYFQASGATTVDVRGGSDKTFMTIHFLHS